MDPIIISINAVAFQEDGMWVARCLEYNFASCAESLDELARELRRQVIDQIEADLEAGREPFFGYKPAPPQYWELFEEARRVSVQPVRPSKSLSQRWHEFRERLKVETQLFPIPTPVPC